MKIHKPLTFVYTYYWEYNSQVSSKAFHHQGWGTGSGAKEAVAAAEDGVFITLMISTPEQSVPSLIPSAADVIGVFSSSID